MPDIRPTFTQVLSKTLNRGRRRGWGEVATLAAHRVRETVLSRDSLVMFTRDTGGVFETQEELHFRETHSADAEAYALWIGTDSSTTFAQRLSSSTRCFVVTSEERFVHASWVTPAAAWTRELGRYVSPPPGDAYIYESFTRTEVRGRGVYPFALRNIAARVGEEGIGKLWVAVEKGNTPSIKAVSKAGFEVAFEIPFGRRLGKVWIDSPTGPLADAASPFLSVTPNQSSL